MKKINFLLIMLLSVTLGYGQTVIFEQDFNGTTLPDDWYSYYGFGGGDTHWTFGSNDVPGTTNDFPTNAAIFDDDAAGDDGLHDYVALTRNNSTIGTDLTPYQNIELNFDYIFQVFGDAGTQTFHVVFLNESITGYVIVKSYNQDTELTNETINISQAIITHAGDIDPSALHIGFLFDDIDGSYGWGAGVDNVVLTGYLPPANDDCSGAMNLPVQNDMPDYASTTPYAGSIVGATDSGVAVTVCEGDTGTANDDVWFSFTANTEEVHITVDDVFDGVVNLFEGSCGSLSQIGCADALEGTPQIDASGLTIGDTYYIRVFNYYASPLPSANTGFDISVWEEGAAGIADNVIDGFSLFPNPVQDIVNIHTQNKIDAVSLYNVLGQKIKNTAPNTTKTQLDLSNLPTGAYIVKVQAGEQISSYNLIKE